MKQLLTRQALIAVLLVVLLPAVLWSNDVPTVRVAAFNYYPAIFLDTDNQVRGFYVDMLDEISAREQIRFEYVFGSWSEGLERLRSGEVDLVTSAAYTEERATFMDFGEQILLTVWGELYIPQDLASVPISELQDQPIAIMRGDHNARSFQEHLDKFGISSHFIEYGDFDEVFVAVKDQQVVGGIVNSIFGGATAKGHHAELLSFLDDYLLEWRNDSTSVYYQARLKWGAGQEPEEVIPVWVAKLVAVAAVIFISGLIFIVLLRHRVNRATGELQKSNNMIRLLLDSTAEGIYGLDPQGICTFCNEASLRILGFDNAEQVLGQNMHDLIHHSNSDETVMPAAECPLLQGLDRQVHSDSEVFWRTDGSCFPVEYWSYPIRQHDKIFGVVISFVDITERQRTEEALRESEERFKKMFRNHSAVMLLVKPETGEIFDANDAAVKFYRYSRDQLLSLNISHINTLSPDVVAAERQAAIEENRNHFIFPHRRSDGEIKTVEVHSTPITVNSSVLLFSIIHDITERKRIEQDLIDQKNAYQSILSASHDGFLIVDSNGKVLDVNSAYLTFSGYDRDE